MGDTELDIIVFVVLILFLSFFNFFYCGQYQNIAYMYVYMYTIMYYYLLTI